MGLKKKVYCDCQTVISAENLNDIQDAIIDLETENVADAVRGTASGAEVYLSDVSPREHDISVKLSSASAKLYRGGKNLFEAALVQDYSQNGVTITYDSTNDCLVFAGESEGTSSYRYNINILGEIGKNYYATADCIGGTVTVPSGGYATCLFGKGDTTSGAPSSFFGVHLRNTRQTSNATLDMKYITSFWFWLTAGVKFENFKVRIHLEKSNTPTAYEKFVEPVECPVHSDGTARAPSAYPTTRLYTDTEGVKITAEYNKDTNRVINGLLERISALEAAVVKVV